MSVRAPESIAPSRPPHAPWMLLSVLLPVGLGAWVPFVAGLRARRPAWTAIGAGLILLALAGFVLVAVSTEDTPLSTVAGLVIILAWIAGAATTLAIYGPYRRRRAALASIEALEHRSETEELHAQHARRQREERFARAERERERGRALAREDRHAALERGVGRPDLPGADHCHLVDVNHAPPGVLTTLPGIDDELARRIVATREQVSPFSSVADVGFLLELPHDTVERLERSAIAI